MHWLDQAQLFNRVTEYQNHDEMPTFDFTIEKDGEEAVTFYGVTVTQHLTNKSKVGLLGFSFVALDVQEDNVEKIS